jgi:replication factor C large subunit
MLVEGREVLEARDSEVVGKRNQLKELDSALREMFGADSARRARDATFDLDMTPDDLEKWIEESIPAELRHPEDMAVAFDALSRSDIYLGRTRRLQYYALWSYAKEMMTGGVALARKHGPRPHVPEYRFPGQFIVLSRAKGPRTARTAIAAKMSPYIHTSRRLFVRTVLPLLAVMVRNDRELLDYLIKEVELDESDVAFLLGLRPDDRAAEQIVMEARGPPDADAGPSRPKASSRASRSAHRF